MVVEEGWDTLCVLLSSLCLSLLQPPNRPLQRSTEPKHTTWRETWICCSTKYYQDWPIIAPQHNLCRGPQVSALLQPKAWLQPQAQSQLQGQATTPVSALILSGSRVLSFLPHVFIYIVFFTMLLLFFIAITYSYSIIFSCLSSSIFAEWRQLGEVIMTLMLPDLILYYYVVCLQFSLWNNWVFFNNSQASAFSAAVPTLNKRVGYKWLNHVC